MPDSRVAYDFAIVRLAARVHLGAVANVGVLVHARTQGFLDARVLEDERRIGRLVPGVDASLVCRYLESIVSIARGDEEGGRLALLPPSERFHWLTAPRSDLLHCTPVHVGLTRDPSSELELLYSEYVDGS